MIRKSLLIIVITIFITSVLALETNIFTFSIDQNMHNTKEDTVRLFLCGDVMTGRGIDQILPNPVDPVINESYMKSARGYVDLAESAKGDIPYPVDFTYIWGDAIKYWNRFEPDLKIINLETSITTNDEYMRNKAVTYRMNPDNISCLTEVQIDYCAMGNNHVLDYGVAGLEESMKTLEEAGLSFSGCGSNITEARKPALLDLPSNGRLIVFSLGMPSSGVPHIWAAGKNKPGVYFVDQYKKAVEYISDYRKNNRQPGDVILASVHWGGNWGYDISSGQKEFAHALIDEAEVDVVHGHSSHHIKGIEVYKGRPVIYGAGDFLNDYEGIEGHEEYRDDLTLMYFLDIDPSNGKLYHMEMVPLQIKNMKLNEVSDGDADLLYTILDRECKKLGSSIGLTGKGTFILNW